MQPTRARILEAALRLFADQGFAATTVKQIEQAAGLSAGAGGLYRHFASKHELLEAVVRHQVEANRELVARLESPDPGPPADLHAELVAVARSGLARLEAEQGLTRLLLRDLADHPTALALAGEGDIEPVLSSLAHYLAGRDTAGRVDATILAVVVAGATTNFWLLRDIFGTHPAGVTAEAFTTALADLVELAITPPPDAGPADART